MYHLEFPIRFRFFKIRFRLFFKVKFEFFGFFGFSGFYVKLSLIWAPITQFLHCAVQCKKLWLFFTLVLGAVFEKITWNWFRTVVWKKRITLKKYFVNLQYYKSWKRWFQGNSVISTLNCTMWKNEKFSLNEFFSSNQLFSNFFI